jgi:hypothetical protein
MRRISQIFSTALFHSIALFGLDILMLRSTKDLLENIPVTLQVK